MSRLQNLTDRVLTLLGLDLDFSVNISRDPFNQITEDLDLEVLQIMLHDHDYDAFGTIQAIFGDEVPRVIQGVRL